jgi:hypothetical protein
MQDCDPKTYSCTSRNALKKAKLSEGRLRSNGEAARKGPRRKDAKIAHIKRRVPLGEKTTHIDKARIQTWYAQRILQGSPHIRLTEYPRPLI